MFVFIYLLTYFKINSNNTNSKMVNDDNNNKYIYCIISKNVIHNKNTRH